MASAGLYVGLMSGTSLDAVDAALVEFDADPAAERSPAYGDRAVPAVRHGAGLRVLAASALPMPDDLQAELLALQQAGPDELARGACASNRLADLYAQAVREVLAAGRRPAATVVAIGCHGQTVRHRPEQGYTVQLNNPARLAEATGIAVVADFRSRDVAAGGQGAPLVPAFHAAVFGRTDRHRVVVNIGGIANVTDLPASAAVRGWDTGPGNVLLDAWAQRHLGTAFDRDGAFAATGTVDVEKLSALLTEPYFALPPPKSTGRDLFDAGWIDRAGLSSLGLADAQATLTALTAATIGDAIARHCAAATEVLVCGGGARNATLMAMLAQRLSPRMVGSTEAAGLPAALVEPVAFAWLARCTLAREPASLPTVTGARGPRVLGAVWPA